MQRAMAAEAESTRNARAKVGTLNIYCLHSFGAYIFICPTEGGTGLEYHFIAESNTFSFLFCEASDENF